MKTLLLLISFVTFFNLEAGYGEYYGSMRVDTYDPVSGSYYKAITINNEEKSFLGSSSKKSENISNIAIYNPQKNSHTLLFAKDDKRDLSFFLFESGYHSKSVLFNGEVSSGRTSHTGNIKNNNFIVTRETKDKLLVGIKNTNKKLTELWVAKKDGSELKKLTDVPFESTWHIDIKNSKLRIVTTKDGEFNISSFDW